MYFTGCVIKMNENKFRYSYGFLLKFSVWTTVILGHFMSDAAHGSSPAHSSYLSVK